MAIQDGIVSQKEASRDAWRSDRRRAVALAPLALVVGLVTGGAAPLYAQLGPAFNPNDGPWIRFRGEGGYEGEISEYNPNTGYRSTKSVTVRYDLTMQFLPGHVIKYRYDDYFSRVTVKSEWDGGQSRKTQVATVQRLSDREAFHTTGGWLHPRPRWRIEKDGKSVPALSWEGSPECLCLATFEVTEYIVRGRPYTSNRPEDQPLTQRLLFYWQPRVEWTDPPQLKQDSYQAKALPIASQWKLAFGAKLDWNGKKIPWMDISAQWDLTQ
jgi:hypothetical protein